MEPGSVAPPERHGLRAVPAADTSTVALLLSQAKGRNRLVTRILDEATDAERAGDLNGVETALRKAKRISGALLEGIIRCDVCFGEAWCEAFDAEILARGPLKG